jgi:hypothetical protein
MPSKDGALGCQGLPDSASAEKKKAPEIRGLVHLECSSLPTIAESEITPTQSSPAASLKYHKPRGSTRALH